MGKYFSVAELSRSQVASSRGIDNAPQGDIKDSLEVMIDKLLDPVREAWGAPITVNSGYRSLALNSAVGGVATSQHTKGQAVDITAGSPEKNKQLFDLVISKGFDFDQLIDERNYTWLHLSYKASGCRNQVLHL
ncbi:MAG: D-Ala-D-Ala carboxypeptidase family metallohydrolase [Rikenellaceae bacterium]